jgi:Zn-dependent peptidase ImmA (M78 family)
LDSYDPFEHADALGIKVLHRPIRTANGLWLPDHNTIVIKTGLRRILERSTLAHEIGHAELGHVDDCRKHERQADRYAAAHLIDENSFAGGSAGYEAGIPLTAVALQLGVTVRILCAYAEIDWWAVEGSDTASARNAKQEFSRIA